jgi:predicted MPP superfamily phosphohydrolase
VGDFATRLCSSLPGNQILQVHAHHKTVCMPQLPPELDGLRIAQVTDLHMTGQLTGAFFEVAVARVNRWQPDLVAITGDLVDDPQCIAWISTTLGRLQGRYGVYAILGNHDQRLQDVAQLRRALTDCGIEDLGSRFATREMRGIRVLLAGNECPWFPPEPDLDPARCRAAAFSILLSHSPDQLPWARRHGFRLMLAGHTHGGQIRFPLIGPVVCPSRYGVRYASGLFDRPPTLLHVSRGLSGVQPLRLHCPPELTLLELRCERDR